MKPIGFISIERPLLDQVLLQVRELYFN